MTTESRIESFILLGKKLAQAIKDLKSNTKTPDADALSSVIIKARNSNGWFTESQTIQSLQNLLPWLQKNALTDWTRHYHLSNTQFTNKKIAVVMAGNLPMVNFHDFLSVLFTGHAFLGKLSVKDSHLLPFFADWLIEIEPDWQKQISFTKQPVIRPSAIIATGSNNAARYFDYYFSKYPNIIRKNRNSAAIVSGKETDAEMQGFAKDIYSFFGLGCRNVNHVFLPKHLSIEKFLQKITIPEEMLQHHKYNNNLEYNKAILMLEKRPFFETNGLLVVENESFASPVATLHYSTYETLKEVENALAAKQEQIQVVSTTLPFSSKFQCVKPGKTQMPGLFDYPDGKDLVQFLLSI